MRLVARGTSVALARVAALAALAAGCGNLQGLGGPTPPLQTFNVEAVGALPPGAPPPTSLQIAMVWGAQWVTEPFCILAPDPSDAALNMNGLDAVNAVIAAGCRDPLGFVPARATDTVAVTIGTPTALPIYTQPATDLLVGGITSRVGYASLVLYDDVDGNGLGLSQSHPSQVGGDRGDRQDTVDSADIVYGASFLTMTQPDQRVAFLQGTFNEMAAFYPRKDCPDPLENFSVLTTGGFTEAAAEAATLAGTLPAEDPNACQTWPADTLISVTAQTPPADDEVSCDEQTLDGSVRYFQPPTNEPDLTGRTWACAHLPSFDAGSYTNLIQLVVSGRSGDKCKGLTHYSLRGCRESVSCAVPDWDFTANPPYWWKCPSS